MWAWLNISGATAAQKPGAWQVELQWNSSELFRLPFSIH
jgi:hypothetical protein